MSTYDGVVTWPVTFSSVRIVSIKGVWQSKANDDFFYTRFAPGSRGSTPTEAQGSEHKIRFEKALLFNRGHKYKNPIVSAPVLKLHNEEDMSDELDIEHNQVISWLGFSPLNSTNAQITKDFLHPPAGTGTITSFEVGSSLHILSKTQTPGSLCLVRVWPVLYCVLKETMFDSLKALRSN